MSALAQRPGAIVWQARGGIDAIEQHSHMLARVLPGATYVPDGLPGLARRKLDPAWVLLQYNPFRYGRAGVAPRLLADAARLRSGAGRPRFAVLVHEAWIEMRDARSAAIGGWQRAQLRGLLRMADAVLASTEGLAAELGSRAVHVPSSATVMPVGADRASERARLGVDGMLVVALFGRAHPSRALPYAEAAIAALATAHGTNRIAVLNLGADAPAVRVPPGARTVTPGPLSEAELSRHLVAADLALIPLVDGLSTKRSTMMAALAHGLPVLGLDGVHTDPTLRRTAPHALRLSPVGDPIAYGRAAVALAADPAELHAVGAAGHTLYTERFDWPVVGERIAAAVRSRPRRIAFVANDVGGPGGMERVSEKLVEGYLAAGREVTVIARSCALAPRSGLTFRRVRTPARPAGFAYPAFVAAATAMLGGERGAIVHTTGAIALRRCDLSTIHYCHAAARSMVEGSRASRATPAYRLNAAVSGWLSRAGETWCYRPGRTGLLCAVSEGVADELRGHFPRLETRTIAIANGVDTERFRPDAGARNGLRSRLEIGDGAPVAVFAGGDWERKGLAFAVAALAHADSWHLLVAGGGDANAVQRSAAEAGVLDRLHLLGRTDEMPAVYAAADAFVFPTTYEAFPLVVLEAAASGLPLLVTSVNGVGEVLKDGVSGWFVRRDSADIGARLSRLAADAPLAKTMGEAARAAASRYTWRAMVDRYLAVLEEIEQ